MYNMEELIIPCIRSILQSPLPKEEYEIIVWDDGSTDYSAEVVKSIQNEGTVNLIRHVNCGVSFVRNAALQKAHGEYIWFVDSDDLVASANVLPLLETAEKDQLDMLLFNWKSLEGDTLKDGIHDVKDSLKVVRGRDLYIKQVLNMAPWCYLYRRSFLSEHNLTFPEDYKTCEDVQFNQKALFFAQKVRTSSLIGYHYRQRAISATQGQGNRVVRDHIRRIKDECEFFNNYSDRDFLTMVLYRNVREINVWLAWSQREDSLFDDIKSVLTQALDSFKPKIGRKTLYLSLMTKFPERVYSIQLIANRLKRKIRSYIK